MQKQYPRSPRDTYGPLYARLQQKTRAALPVDIRNLESPVQDLLKLCRLRNFALVSTHAVSYAHALPKFAKACADYRDHINVITDGVAPTFGQSWQKASKVDWSRYHNEVLDIADKFYPSSGDRLPRIVSGEHELVAQSKRRRDRARQAAVEFDAQTFGNIYSDLLDARRIIDDFADFVKLFGNRCDVSVAVSPEELARRMVQPGDSLYRVWQRCENATASQESVVRAHVVARGFIGLAAVTDGLLSDWARALRIDPIGFSRRKDGAALKILGAEALGASMTTAEITGVDLDAVLPHVRDASLNEFAHNEVMRMHNTNSEIVDAVHEITMMAQFALSAFGVARDGGVSRLDRAQRRSIERTYADVDVVDLVAARAQAAPSLVDVELSFGEPPKGLL